MSMGRSLIAGLIAVTAAASVLVAPTANSTQPPRPPTAST